MITQHKDSLKIPNPLIEFIWKYPLIFQEFILGGISIHPYIKLTQQVLDLDAEEQLVHESESYQQSVVESLVMVITIFFSYGLDSDLGLELVC